MNFKLLFVVLVFFQNKINAEYDRLYASTPELFYMDNYDTCMLLEDEAFVCYLDFTIEPIIKENPPEIWTFIKNISSVESNYRHDILRHSICVPKTCPGVKISDENDPLLKKALENCYNKKLEDMQLKGTITDLHCQTHKPKYPVDWLDICVGILFIIYILFILYATYYERSRGNKTSDEYQKSMITPKSKILSTFSIAKNWKRLTTTNNSPDIKKFQSIQSIRFYNSLAVILAHTGLGLLAGPVANTKMPEQLYIRSPSVFFGNARIGMAVFFFFSSFIFSKKLFKKMDNKSELTLNMARETLVKRFFRLMPAAAAVILFHATWLRHFGNGPRWFTIDQEYLNCRKNGWSNLLFLNKIVDPKNMCLLPTWYLAVSTQYFILSVFFIWILKKYEDYIWYILGTTISLAAVATFQQNYYYDCPSLLLFSLEDVQGYKNFIKSDQLMQYTSFVSNLSVHLVGIGFGYFLYKHQKENPKKKIFNTKIRLYFIYAMSVVLICCVAGPGLVILYYSNIHDRFWASVNVSLSRIFFSFSLGVVLLGFSENIGKLDHHGSRPDRPSPVSFLNINLSKVFKELVLPIVNWTPTIILSRLSYSAYLLQMSIIMLRAGRLRFPSYLSYFTMLTQYFSDAMLTYIAALFVSLLIEMPFCALRDVLFIQEKKKKTQENGLKNK